MSKPTNAGWLRNNQLAEYLQVTKVTIHRWQRDPALNFPQPSLINNTPFTKVEAIDEWMRSRVVHRNREVA